MAIGGGLLLVGLVFAAAWRRRRWNRSVEAWIARVAADAPTVSCPGSSRGEADLPDLVARWLGRALADGDGSPPAGAGPTRLVTIRHEGEFHMGEGRGWRPFGSRQVFGVPGPGFVWDARIRLGPGLVVRVLDAYASGAAAMSARLGGVIPVMRADDGPELRVAALQRCLAERVWIPGALLPPSGIAWEEVDDTSVRARLVDDDVEAVLTFRFDASGLPSGVSSEARFREIRGAYVPTPWEGRFSDYRTYGGVLIPAAGEVAWLIDGERRPYWRARIRSVVYEPGA